MSFHINKEKKKKRKRGCFILSVVMHRQCIFLPIFPSSNGSLPSYVIGCTVPSFNHPKSCEPKNSTSMYPSGTVKRFNVVLGYFTSFDSSFILSFKSCLLIDGGILDILHDPSSRGRVG